IASASIPNSSQIIKNMWFGCSKISSEENAVKVSTIRSFISLAALLVKVMAKMFLKASLKGDFKRIFKYSFTSVNVFPLPAEALYTKKVLLLSIKQKFDTR